MRIKFDDEPAKSFSENDMFGRSGLAKQILKVSAELEHSTTFLLNARWGTGKTYFLKQYSLYAGTCSVPIMTFDAFKYDLNDDAFASLAGFVAEQVKEADPESDLASSLTKQAGKVALALLKGGLGAAASYATAGIVNAKIFEQVSDEASKAIEAGAEQAFSEIAETAMGDLIDAHSQMNSRVSDFRDLLEKAADLLLKKEGASPGTKLIFVIDELDRCRPTYALSVIECIKHVFNTDNIDFLISADKVQLQNIVGAIYGNAFDAHGYLEKFFDIKINLEVYGPQDNFDAKIYIEYLLGKKYECCHEGAISAGEVLSDLSLFHGFSLREIEKFSRIISMAYTIGNPEGALLVPLAVVKHRDEALYKQLNEKTANLKDVLSCLRIPSETENRNLKIARDCLTVTINGEVDSNAEFEQQAARILGQNVGLGRVIPIYCQRYLESFTVVDG